MKKELTQERIRQVLDYNPETGVFTWKVVASNRRPVGSVAGTSNWKGYTIITVDKVRVPAHRLAFLYMMGEMPKGQVDHKNGVKGDNSWGNLREASPSQNRYNAGPQANNTTGFKGVFWSKRGGRFLAQIASERKLHYIGYFDCPREAAHAYNKAAIELHGEFAVLNPI